jgi:hypothetical protein
MRSSGSGPPTSGSWQGHLAASIQFETVPSASWRLHISNVAAEFRAVSLAVERDVFAKLKAERAVARKSGIWPPSGK